jgi:RNA recognition motif-containing protein
MMMSHPSNTHSHTHPMTHSQRSSPAPNAATGAAAVVEVFFGNLSYFCEESHLFALVNDYFQVTNVRIMRNEDRSRSLMYGFVSAASYADAQEMCRLLNGHLFMGRHLK